MQRLPTLNFRLFNGDPYLFTPCSRCINPSHQLSHPIAGFQNHAFSTRSYLELGRDIPLLQGNDVTSGYQDMYPLEIRFRNNSKLLNIEKEEEPIDIDSLTPKQMKEILKKMMGQQ